MKDSVWSPRLGAPTATAPEARILLVDDTDMNLFVVKGLLKRTLLQIDTAVDGKQALFMTEKENYDLLLIDHRMPVMDGMEMIKNLRLNKDNPNATKPCIVLTANAVAGAREEYMKAGFDDYVIKPVSGKQLEEVLLKYLPQWKIHRKDEKKESHTPPAEESEDPLRITDQRLFALEENGYLNIREGIAYASDEKMYLAALLLFAKTIDQKCADIRSHFEEEDWDGVLIKAHALKSSARVIGAEKLSDMSRAVELSLKNGDVAYVREHVDELLAYYGSYKKKLSEISGEE